MARHQTQTLAHESTPNAAAALMHVLPRAAHETVIIKQMFASLGVRTHSNRTNCTLRSRQRGPKERQCDCAGGA